MIVDPVAALAGLPTQTYASTSALLSSTTSSASKTHHHYASSSVAPIPSVIPTSTPIIEKATDVGNRTLWYVCTEKTRRVTMLT